MKHVKRLISLLLAIVLIALCTFGSGLTVHAQSESVTDAFSWIKVNGQKISLSLCPDSFTALKCKSKVTIEWKLKSGWAINEDTVCEEADSFKCYKDHAVVTLSANKSALFELSAEKESMYEDQYRTYYIDLITGTPKMSIECPWAGAGSQEIDLANAGESQNYSVVSLTSDNPTVLKVTKKNVLYRCSATPRKAGKSKVTLVLKVNGKNVTFTNNITVYNYPKPFTSLKVAGKAVDLQKNKYEYSLKGRSAKVVFKLGSGWKLTDAYYRDTYYNYRDFRNGGTIKRGNADYIYAYIYVENKAKKTFCYKITLHI